MNRYKIFCYLILITIMFAGCDGREFQKEEPVLLPPTQIRIINLAANESIAVKVNEERLRDSVSPFVVTAYNTNVFSDQFQQIDLIGSAGERLSSNAPFPIGITPAQLQVDESNTVANVPPDNALFVFKPNQTYAFYVVPTYPFTGSVNNPQYTGASLAGSYRVIQEDVLKAFPGRCKVRYLNFTNQTRFDQQNPNSLPRLFSRNPLQTQGSSGDVIANINSEFKLINDKAGSNVSDYQLLEIAKGVLRFYLVFLNAFSNL